MGLDCGEKTGVLFLVDSNCRNPACQDEGLAISRQPENIFPGRG
jgi:hypothetical protein